MGRLARGATVWLCVTAFPVHAASTPAGSAAKSPDARGAKSAAGATAAAAAGIRHEFTHPALGTTFRVVVYCPDAAATARVEAAVVRRLAQLDEVFDDARPSSEISQIHANAGLGAVRVSDDLYALLRQINRLADRAPGGLEPTGGAMAGLWARASAERRLPSEAELTAARDLTGADKLRLDPIGRTVHLTREGMRLDVAPAARGYACDAVLTELRKAGFRSALVEAGDDTIAVGDEPPGRPGWTIQVRDADAKSTYRVLTLKRLSVASSGRVGEGIEIGGTRYSPLLNPLTGTGSRNLRPVTVLARRAWNAVALARAASVLGRTDGGKLLRTPGARGWFHGGNTAKGGAEKKGETEKAVKSRPSPADPGPSLPPGPADDGTGTPAEDQHSDEAEPGMGSVRVAQPASAGAGA